MFIIAGVAIIASGLLTPSKGRVLYDGKENRSLKSAVANAEQKGVSDVDSLFVKTVMVDQGPVLRRFMPRAQGRASRIRKPTSHITVVLDVK